tara:strand:+ start:367 stop:3369 length:3003 start_codon:yes stop_codon:yes gene_type:complete
MAEPQHKDLKQVGPNDWVIYNAHAQQWVPLVGELKERVLSQPKPSPPGASAHFTRGVATGGALGEPLTKEAFTWVAEKAGLPITRQEPLTPTQRAAQYAGIAMGSVPGLLTAAKSPYMHAIRRTPVGGSLLRMITQGYNQAPMTTFAAEGLAGAGAGYAAEMARGRPALEPVAEFAGSMIPVGLMNYAARSIPGITARALMKLGEGAQPAINVARKAMTPEGRDALREDVGTFAERRRDQAQQIAEETAFLPTAKGIEYVEGVPTLKTGTLPVQTAQSILRRKIGGGPSQGGPIDITESLERPPLSPQTTVAQRTQNPALVEIEKHFETHGPEVTPESIAAWDKRNLANQAYLTEQVERLAPETIDAAARQQAEELRTSASQLGGRVETVPRTAIASQVSKDVLKAFTDGKRMEHKLWKAAEAENPVKMPIVPVLEAWKKILRKVKKSQLVDIPPFMDEVFTTTRHGRTAEDPAAPGRISRDHSGIWDARGENPYEIQGGISRLKDFARENPGSYKSVLSTELAQAADKILDERIAEGLMPGYERAVNLSRSLHKVWDKNVNIWKRTRPSGRPGSESDLVNNPELLFERLGFGRETGATRSADANTIRELLDVSAFSRRGAGRTREGAFTGVRNQATIDGLQDHFLQRFMEATDGGTNAARAEQFIQNHRDLWDKKRFPELGLLGDDLKLFTQQARRLREVEGIEGELNKIMKEPNPAAVFTSMAKMGTGGAGEANRDLWRNALLRRTLRHSSGDRIGDLYQAGIDTKGVGQRLSEDLQRPRVRQIFETLFTPEEVKNLELIGKELDSVERALIVGGPNPRAGVSPGGDLAPDSFLVGLMNKLTFGGGMGGAMIAQYPPFSWVKRGGSIQVAAGLAGAGRGVAKKKLQAGFEDVLQAIVKDENLLMQSMTDTKDLDMSQLTRLANMVKKVYGSLGIPEWRPMLGTETQRAWLKAQIAREEEENPRRARERFLPRTSSIGQREITPVPAQPQGPRIGPPRR